jgi:hypothetical protein
MGMEIVSGGLALLFGGLLIIRRLREVDALRSLAALSALIFLLMLTNILFFPAAGTYRVQSATAEGYEYESYGLSIENIDSGSQDIVNDLVPGSIPGLDLNACHQDRERCGCLTIERSFWLSLMEFRAEPCPCRLP